MMFQLKADLIDVATNKGQAPGEFGFFLVVSFATNMLFGQNFLPFAKFHASVNKKNHQKQARSQESNFPHTPPGPRTSFLPFSVDSIAFVIQNVKFVVSLQKFPSNWVPFAWIRKLYRGMRDPECILTE